MRKKLIIFGSFTVLLALVLMHGCAPQRSISSENLAHIYNSERTPIRADYRVFHPEENLTTVFLRVAASDLTPGQNLETFRMESDAVVDLKVYPPQGLMVRAVDSVLVRINDAAPGKDDNYLHTAINLSIRSGYTYRAVMKITDINKNETQEMRFEINKLNPNHRHNFLVFETAQRIPLYTDYVTTPTRLRIKNNESKDMTVRYYNRNFPLPPPPFSSYTPPPFRYEADSVFSMRATSDFSILDINRPGFFHVLKDGNQKSGLSIFTFPDPFPMVTSTEQMFESLRYVTTEWEFREMRQRSNLRLAVEKFWMDCAGSKERAREMIQVYYGRVEEANRFFTSYVEGWKTDRGLIHIVYGRPNIIYKTDRGETWIYGEDRNTMSLSFAFVKVINPFTDNDYRLSRDESYKASWYRAIESWRNGRIHAN